jgi:structural maintenance of chromosome 3 (chondroitin sulfate proteoglycan 6)
LFHVVVDNDDTASKVLEIMLREKTGRVTFMPLNRLKPKNPSIPTSDDAIPLLDQLEYDEAHEKAFQQVFGKTCVCHNLTIAAAYVKSHGINTITLDGDKVDRKGALTGGYHDVRWSRIDTIKNVQTWRERHSEESKKSKATKARIVELDQEIAQVSGRLTVLNLQQNQIREARDSVQSEGVAYMREKQRLEDRIAKLEQSIEELEQELQSSDEKIKSYKQELGTPLVEGLTQQEEALLDSLAKEVEQRTKQVAELAKEKNAMEGKKVTTEIELNEKLIKRRDELQARIESLNDVGVDESASTELLDTRARELRSLNTSIENVNNRVQRKYSHFSPQNPLLTYCCIMQRWSRKVTNWPPKFRPTKRRWRKYKGSSPKTVEIYPGSKRPLSGILPSVLC